MFPTLKTTLRFDGDEVDGREEIAEPKKLFGNTTSFMNLLQSFEFVFPDDLRKTANIKVRVHILLYPKTRTSLLACREGLK